MHYILVLNRFWSAILIEYVTLTQNEEFLFTVYKVADITVLRLRIKQVSVHPLPSQW